MCAPPHQKTPAPLPLRNSLASSRLTHSLTLRAHLTIAAGGNNGDVLTYNSKSFVIFWWKRTRASVLRRFLVVCARERATHPAEDSFVRRAQILDRSTTTAAFSPSDGGSTRTRVQSRMEALIERHEPAVGGFYRRMSACGMSVHGAVLKKQEAYMQTCPPRGEIGKPTD